MNKQSPYTTKPTKNPALLLFASRVVTKGPYELGRVIKRPRTQNPYELGR